jgi:uncharacterized protein (TIGR03437 family)
MVYTSETQVAAILASRTPVGNASLVLNYNGRSSEPTRISVVRNAFGGFSRNQAGTGPGIVQNVKSEIDRPTNSMLDPARPGQPMIIWGTGLGAIAGDDGQGPSPGDLSLNVEVLVGGRRAKLLYKGRSGCCAGIDQVIFEVPPDVDGCYVPVGVLVNGLGGNFTTISVSASGAVCSDPHGFTESDLNLLAQRDEVRIGFVSLSRTDIFASVPQGSVTFKTDLALASFSRYTRSQVLATGSSSGGGSGKLSLIPVPLGTCIAYNFRGPEVAVEDPVRPDPLDAGTALTVVGPNGSKRILRQSPGNYYAELGGGIPGGPGGGSPEFLVSGSYALDNGTGGRDVSAFKTTRRIDSGFVWSNRADIAAVDRTQQLAVTWRGADPITDVVVILGASISSAEIGGVFYCMEKPSVGAFIIPASILSVLPPSGAVQGIPTAFLQVGRMQKLDSGRFQAPGVDIASFMSMVSSQRILAYSNPRDNSSGSR